MNQKMTQTMLALSLGFGGVILATQIAHGTPQCDTREVVTALLSDRYGETRRAIGTWTITLTLPDGQMCLMASGTGFEALTDDLLSTGPRI